MASKITISELIEAKQSNPNHSIFNSHTFFNKLVLAILNREIEILQTGSMGPELEWKLEIRGISYLILALTILVGTLILHGSSI